MTDQQKQDAAAQGAPLNDNAADSVSEMKGLIESLRTAYAGFAHHLTDMQRKRLLRAGLKNHGFAEEAYHTARETPRLVPGYVGMARFTEDYQDFENRRMLCDLVRQAALEMEEGMLAAGDLFYRDALGYYNYVKEAARRGDPDAEVVYGLLKPRFEKTRRTKAGGKEPTEREAERDVRSLLHGTKEGEVVVRNVKPHSEGGAREVIDELTRE